MNWNNGNNQQKAHYMSNKPSASYVYLYKSTLSFLLSIGGSREVNGFLKAIGNEWQSQYMLMLLGATVPPPLL